MCHPCAIMWEADVPPAVGRIAATLSLASLDQGLLSHLIWDEVCICLGLSNFSFSYRKILGTGGFLGGPSCGLRMLFYWICPLVTPTPTLLWLGLLLPLSPATCSFSHPPPTGFFHNTWLAGCMGHLGVHRM